MAANPDMRRPNIGVAVPDVAAINSDFDSLRRDTLLHGLKGNSDVAPTRVFLDGVCTSFAKKSLRHQIRNFEESAVLD